jgi:hypothetical protein
VRARGVSARVDYIFIVAGDCAAGPRDRRPRRARRPTNARAVTAP